MCSRYRTCLSTWLCHTPRGQVHPLVHAQGLWSPPMSPPPHGHRSFPGAANTFSFAARVAQSIGTIRKAASPSGNKSQKREQNREAEREQCGWKRSKENRNGPHSPDDQRDPSGGRERTGDPRTPPLPAPICNESVTLVFSKIGCPTCFGIVDTTFTQLSAFTFLHLQ